MLQRRQCENSVLVTPTGQGLCEVYRRPRMCFQDPCRAIEDRPLHLSFAVSCSVLHEACSPHTRFSPLARRVGN